MSNHHRTPDHASRFLADYTVVAGNRVDGGPPVDLKLVEDYADGALGREPARLVRGYLAKYKAWAAALLSVEGAVPKDDGPPVDQGLIDRYLAGETGVEEQVTVRRNSRLYKNWYEAVNRED